MDDGRGLDVIRVKQRAVQSGILTEFEAEKLTHDQVINLIYEKGFSTATEVDENAGRGRGMNLVKTLIEEMNGTFTTTFEEGKYFKLIINLPISGIVEDQSKEHETTDS